VKPGADRDFVLGLWIAVFVVALLISFVLKHPEVFSA
jgi:hypothetical protein